MGGSLLATLRDRGRNTVPLRVRFQIAKAKQPLRNVQNPRAMASVAEIVPFTFIDLTATTDSDGVIDLTSDSDDEVEVHESVFGYALKMKTPDDLFADLAKTNLRLVTPEENLFKNLDEIDVEFFRFIDGAIGMEMLKKVGVDVTKASKVELLDLFTRYVEAFNVERSNLKKIIRTSIKERVYQVELAQNLYRTKERVGGHLYMAVLLRERLQSCVNEKYFWDDVDIFLTELRKKDAESAGMELARIWEENLMTFLPEETSSTASPCGPNDSDSGATPARTASRKRKRSRYE